MSATTGTPPVGTVLPPEPTWAKPSIGVYTLSLFVLALAVAVYAKNENGIALMIGAIISNTGTVINYYFGSSSGSTAKTAQMAAQTTTTP